LAAQVLALMVTLACRRWRGRASRRISPAGSHRRADSVAQRTVEGLASAGRGAPNAWAPADEEFPFPDIGLTGSEEGQFTVIPAPSEPGTYRICHEQRALCSLAFKVTS
jgi:hypothetical protein